MMMKIEQFVFEGETLNRKRISLLFPTRMLLNYSTNYWGIKCFRITQHSSKIRFGTPERRLKNGPHARRIVRRRNSYCSACRPVKRRRMTGGRINWAGEEHFGYSRPSGPCLDRTFNAIVSTSVGCFPSAVGVSTGHPFLLVVSGSGKHRGNTEWRPLCRNNCRHHGR